MSTIWMTLYVMEVSKSTPVGSTGWVVVCSILIVLCLILFDISDLI